MMKAALKVAFAAAVVAVNLWFWWPSSFYRVPPGVQGRLVKCDACDGSGQKNEECYHCKGAGMMRNGRGDLYPCLWYGGKGRLNDCCPVCGCTGRLIVQDK
jgi:hypothetical protein